jgi:hypothetical protein
MSLTPDLFDISKLEKSKYECILLIKKYALKHEIFFEDYRNKFPELFM